MITRVLTILGLSALAYVLVRIIDRAAMRPARYAVTGLSARMALLRAGFPPCAHIHEVAPPGMPRDARAVRRRQNPARPKIPLK